MSQKSFAELGVSRAVATALSEQGITSPFPIQQDVIGSVLSGQDVLVRSPTGSGKTLAFGIPIVDRIAAEARRPAALILAPTRELATQIVADLRSVAHSRALRIAPVYGGVGFTKQTQDAIRSHIIVATPGRLEDLLDRRAFSLDQIQILVLDEADRMLDMGFRPAVDRILGQCPPNRQTLFFSATLDGEAGQIAKRYTNNAARFEQGPSERRASTDVEHRFLAIEHDRVEALLGELEGADDLTLVFVRTKHGADRLVKRLRGHGVEAVAMHGNKSQRQREQALDRFESGHVGVLVATDVAARGIDVNRISHVINFDPPADSETYVHRIGRTGRAGAKGVGITLVSPDQHREVAKMAGELGLEHGLRGGSGHHAGAPRHAGAGAPRGPKPTGGSGRGPRHAGQDRTEPGQRSRRASSRRGPGGGGGQGGGNPRSGGTRSGGPRSGNSRGR